jgi:uncharacterized repeat protein (TIGR01451 family)
MKSTCAALLATFFITLNAYAQLEVTITDVTSASCFGSLDGTITANATGGNPPYSYQWNEPFAQTSQIANGLAAGNWCVLVTDNIGDTVSTCATISEPPEIIISGTVNSASCGGGANGSIILVVSGGIPPFVFQWNTGQVGPQPSGLTAGLYEVSVIDANGCTAVENFQVNEGDLVAAISLITNNPCDGPLELQALTTGGSGNYTYSWSTGESTEYISISDTSMVEVTIVDDNNCTAIATAYLPTVTGELETYLSGWLNRGFCRYQYPIIRNNGCNTYNGPVTISIDPDLVWETAIPAPDDTVGNVLTWDNVNLPPGAQFVPQLRTCVPLSVPCPSYDIWMDITVNGQTDQHYPPVLCSYDPNDKQVSPVGIGQEGFITGEEELTYMVRFQNTGTVPATFIHVIDTLDEDLDLYSLRVLATSHDMELSIDGRELDFFFDNINLPDSMSDPAGSQGFLIYTIDMLPALAEGTEIENTANIYFDFNEPVITNTTLNTIDNTVGITDANKENEQVLIYPNPSNGTVNIKRLEENSTVSVFNSLGKLVHQATVTGSSNYSFQMNGAQGVYVLQVASENASKRFKLILTE